jgi:hypothetical protein
VVRILGTNTLLGSKAVISIEQAVEAAITHVNKFSNLLPTGNVRLEEFDYDEKQNEWLITLSFLESVSSGQRSYKTVSVDASDGSLKSMRIRNPYLKP